MSVTHFIPNQAGWQSDGASTAYFLRLKVERSYDVSANRSFFTVSLQAKGAAGVYGGTYSILRDGTLSGGGNTLYAFVQTDGNSSHKVNVDDSETWYDVTSVNNPSSWHFTANHASDGSLTVSFGVNLRLYGYISGGAHYGDFYSRTASLSVTEARASSIASISSSAATQGTLAISMNRASTSFYHKATFTATGVNVMSSAFAASLSYTVPRTWFNSYPNAASFTLTVSIQTYTNSACTTPVGSPATATVTITADAGMVPTLASGFLSAAASGNPTGVSGYVQGVSKAAITLNAAKVSYANNAALASYKVVCQGWTGAGTGTGYTSSVLTGNGTVTITATVTDSRGRTASQSISITVQAYAAPTISAVSVFRCDGSSAADDDGAYIYLKATLNVTAVSGNSGTLKYRYRAAGGSWSAETAIASNTGVRVGGSLNPDTSYEVMFTASDKISAAAPVTRTVPTRKWAMKFRPNGEGVGFGMAPQHSKSLELPADWKLRVGGLNFPLEVQHVSATGTSNSYGSVYVPAATYNPLKNLLVAVLITQSPNNNYKPLVYSVSASMLGFRVMNYASTSSDGVPNVTVSYTIYYIPLE